MEERMDPPISSLAIEKHHHHHPGCLWGVLHILRTYQWQHVKKMMPSKRFSVRRGLGYSRLKTSSHKTSEAQGSVVGKVDDANDEEMSQSSPTENESGQISLTAEDIDKLQDDRFLLPTYRSHFVRTNSIHRLGSSDDSLPDEVREHDECHCHQSDVNTPESAWDQFLLNAKGVPVSCCSGCEMCNTITSMRNLSHDQLDELGKQLLDNALLQNKLETANEPFSRQKSLEDVAAYQSKEVLDALRTFSADNESHQKTLLSSNYALAHHLRALQASSSKRGLTSPLEESSSRNSMKLTKLNSMQNKGGFSGDNVNDIQKQDQASSDPGQTSTSSSPTPHVELKKRRFKDIKQKIKKAIKESRKERYRISMDAIFHKMPYGSKFSKVHKEMIDKWKDSVKNKKKKAGPKSVDEKNNSMPIGKDRLSNIRKSKSVNESLNRYSQLFESRIGNETKPNISDSLKLANKSGPKDMKRMLSLPNLESYCSPQFYESVEAFSSGMPTRGLAGSSKQKPTLRLNSEIHRQLDAFVGNAKQEKLVAEGKVIALSSDQTDPTHTGLVTQDEMVNDSDKLTSKVGNSISQNEQEFSSANNAGIKQAQPSPISVLDSCFQEKVPSPTKLSVPGDPELKTAQLLVDELNFLGRQDDQSVIDSLNEAIVKPDVEKVKLSSRSLNADFQLVQVDKKDEADFNYVRDVLKLSGFSGTEHLGTWHSPAQPVDPSLFEEVEISSPLKSDYFGEDGSNNYDHHLLFDIINEVLLEIYDRSFTYWPRSLSCNCHIRPLPKGCHVLNEVWAIISWYLSSQPEFEPLDYLVVRDLSKSDGWMNLQFESECVGLELEEMILDDLLDEVIPGEACFSQ